MKCLQAVLLLSIMSFNILAQPVDNNSLPVAKEPKSESALDFSGVDTFWEIYESLTADREPAIEQWDKLFMTPGYAALDEREHRRKMLSEAFRLAYLPSKRAQLAETLKKNTWVSYVVPHLQKIPSMRAELMAFKTKLQHTDLLSGAARRTQTILPPGLIRRYPPPPVSFIFFAPDGRGYPKIIVVDLLNLMLYPESEKFFAHELFHFYRRYITVQQKNYADADAPLIEILTNASEEGIADQMDKGDLPFVSEQKLRQMFPDPARRRFYEDYRRFYGESNEWLRRVEKDLEEIARDPSIVNQKGRLLQQELPDSGRIVGAFMARTIIQKLGRRELIKVAGDGLGFWLTYNKAAGHSKGQSQKLSDQAIGIIQRLKQTYG